MQTKCDICKINVAKDFARTSRANRIVDGKTLDGPWAWMCTPCHEAYGVGLGTGRGQLFDTTTGRKLEG